MPLTNAWDETHPAGTDLASSLDDQGRQLKLDVRERMALQHYWSSALSGDNEDGVHKEIAITPTAANLSLLKTNTNQSVTGSSNTPAVDLSATWNTSGAPSAIKLNVADTASAAASNLLDLQISGVSKFAVRKDGVPLFAGVADFPRKSQSESITGNWTFNGAATGLRLVGSGLAALHLGDSSVAVGSKNWVWNLFSSTLHLDTADDAFGAIAHIFRFGRSGTTPTTFEVFPGVANATLTFNGNTTVADKSGVAEGPQLNIGRNTNGGGASGSLGITNLTGTPWHIWVDAASNLRIGLAAPTISGGDLGGTVVGTQTSNLAAKELIAPYEDNASALGLLCATPLYDFKYKNNAFPNDRFIGIITDYTPLLGMDNGKSLNVPTAIGLLIAAVKELERRTRAA